MHAAWNRSFLYRDLKQLFLLIFNLKQVPLFLGTDCLKCEPKNLFNLFNPFDLLRGDENLLVLTNIGDILEIVLSILSLFDF